MHWRAVGPLGPWVSVSVGIWQPGLLSGEPADRSLPGALPVQVGGAPDLRVARGDLALPHT